MLTLASTSRISISIVATDEDGSLQHLLDIILLLAMELLNWVRLQLDIADDAKLLIIETRVLISRLTILAGLLIEIAQWVLGVIHWTEDIGQTVIEIWAEFWFKAGWNYRT